MAKFVVYEKVSEMVYSKVDKSTLSDAAQTGVNLGSGLVAGMAAAVVSQPADTMLSKINKTKGLPGEGTTSRLIKIAKELGIKGSYTGLGARLFMGMFPPHGSSANDYYYISVANMMNSWNLDRWTVCNLRRHQEGSRRRWRCRNWKISGWEKCFFGEFKNICSVYCSCFWPLIFFLFLSRVWVRTTLERAVACVLHRRLIYIPGSRLGARRWTLENHDHWLD